MLSLNKHYNLGELSYSQVDQNWDDLENEVNGLSSRLPLNNYAATTNPTVNDDVTQGYSNGSLWYNRTTDTAFVLTNASSGAANWVEQSAVAGSLAQVVADAADRAETAADAAQLSAGVYPDTASGIAATTEGDYFSVPSAEDDEYLILYRHGASGSATEVKRYPSSAAVAATAERTRELDARLFLSTSGVAATAALERGTYTNGTSKALGAGIYGWRSPFKHNGSQFNTVQFTAKAGAADTPLRVEVMTADFTVLAYGYATVGTSNTTLTVVLNRTVTELDEEQVGYIGYLHEDLSVDVGQPAGGAYAAGDADPNVNRETYFYSGIWRNATPIGNYRVQFRLIDAAANTRRLGVEVDELSGEVSDLSTAVGSKVGKNAVHDIVGAAVPYVTWSHPRGDSEMDGNNNYNFKSAGFLVQVLEPALFNAAKYRIWADDPAASIEWRMWIRDSSAAFNMDSETPAESGEIPAGSFPTSNALYTLRLQNRHFVDAGKWVFVMFMPANGTDVVARRWTSAAESGPARYGLPFKFDAGWDNTFDRGTALFLQTAPKLLLESEELRIRPAAKAVEIPYSNASSGLAATNVQAAIDELLPSVPEPGVPELILPPYIYGVQGRECNVYFDNLHLADASDYLHDVTGVGIGKHQNERWTWTPSASLEEGSLTISAHEKRTGVELATKQAWLQSVDAAAGSGSTKDCMFIGDSLVAAGVISQTVLDLAGSDVMGVNLLGTQGAAPNLHEGRGGWTVGSYVGSNSPFYVNGAVDFPQYLADNGITAPDWVFIHLGINDVFGQTTDAGAALTATAAFDNLDVLIASIQAAGAAINVGLMVPSPPSSDQDAFGANYDSGRTRWRFKRSILIWARKLIERYAGQEASGIYIVPSNVALDTVNNMSRAAPAPVNSRSSDSSERQNNGVHPATSGYQQIGDAVWAFIKNHA